MYHLTHNGKPISKPHPHRVTCYIEALERGLVVRSGRRYWLMGAAIVKHPAEKRKAENE